MIVFKYFIFLICIVLFQFVHAVELKFDAETNSAKLHGPYFKYDLLNSPFSIGPFKFEIQDFGPSFSNIENNTMLTIKWPKALIQSGNINIYEASSSKIIYSQKIKLPNDDSAKSMLYPLADFNWLQNTEILKKGFFYCISDKKNNAYFRICSPLYELKNKKLVQKIESNKVTVLLNENNVPENAQIHLSKSIQKINFVAKFKNGLIVEIKSEAKKINLSDIVLDQKTKKLSLKGEGFTPSNAQVTKSADFKSTFIEANRIKELFDSTKDWELGLDSKEIEFYLYDIGGDIQMFALIPPPIPEESTPPSLEKDYYATYSSRAKLYGTFPEGYTLTTEPPEDIIFDNGNFKWFFPAKNKGEVNFSNLTVSKGNNKYVYSHKMYRGHSFSLTGRLPVTVNSKLETVLGSQFTFDFWPEKIIGSSKASYQRWGFESSYYKNFGQLPLPPSAGVSNDGFEFSFYNFDLLMRLSQGVRPVESSLGLIARYFNGNLKTTVRQPFNPTLYGLGAFWHAAPPGWLDDLLDLYDLFDYPKWLEVSAFYYPSRLENGVLTSGAWSVHGRGRLHFSKSFFFDTSINMMNFDLYREGRDQNTLLFGTRISNIFIYGTVGLGFRF